MCNFLSAIVLRNGDVLSHPMLDSHSELVQHFNLPDTRAHHQHFAKVELTPKGDWLDVSIWKFQLDEQTVPGWWADVSAQAEATLRARAEKMILKTGEHSLLIDGCWVIGGDAVVRDVRAGRVRRVSGGTILGVSGGTIWDVRGGTISGVRGGTISGVRGGTISGVWGGTISGVRGGTISGVSGGTISGVWGGTISGVRGGTISDVSGGTISGVRGGTISDVWGGTISGVRGGTISGVSGGTISRVRGGTISGVRGLPYKPLLDDSAKAHVAVKPAPIKKTRKVSVKAKRSSK